MPILAPVMFISCYLIGAQVSLAVANVTGSTIAGAISGLVGAGSLGTALTWWVKTTRSSQKVQDAQLARHVQEIERLNGDLRAERQEATRERDHGVEMATRVSDLQEKIALLVEQLHGRAANEQARVIGEEVARVLDKWEERRT